MRGHRNSQFNLRAIDKIRVDKAASKVDDLFHNNLIENSLVSFLELDMSRIKIYFNELKQKSIVNITEYLEKHPGDVIALAGMVNILTANKAALILYQAGNKDELNENINIVFNKDSFEGFKKKLSALSEGKTKFQSESIIETLHGNERCVLYKYIVTRGFENTLAKVFVNITDITDIKVNIRDVIKSEYKYRKLFENSNHAICLVDLKSGITLEANNQAVQIMGILKNKIVGKHFTEFYPKEECEYFRNFFKRIINEGPFTENAVIEHESGKKIPVAISGNVISLEDKRVFSWTFRELNKDEIEGKCSIVTDKLFNLTKREGEIFLLIANGFSNKQIANRLFISTKTVETHRANLMGKLDMHKEADLVRHALNIGIINHSNK